MQQILNVVKVSVFAANLKCVTEMSFESQYVKNWLKYSPLYC